MSHSLPVRAVTKIARSLTLAATALTAARVLSVFIADRDRAEAALARAGAPRG